jgi:chaperonin cofactor prefoldin
MNNERRKQLRELIKKIEVLKDELERIENDEEFAYDSMPEGLQATLNGMNSEEAIDKMNEAIECIDEAIECIEEII